MNSLETEPWESSFNSKIKQEYEQYAMYSLKKEKRINIRMTERDLRGIQVKAVQQGIPYQSLISMLVHKYTQGKLLIQN